VIPADRRADRRAADASPPRLQGAGIRAAVTVFGAAVVAVLAGVHHAVTALGDASGLVALTTGRADEPAGGVPQGLAGHPLEILILALLPGGLDHPVPAGLRTPGQVQRAVGAACQDPGVETMVQARHPPEIAAVAVLAGIDDAVPAVVHRLDLVLACETADDRQHTRNHPVPNTHLRLHAPGGACVVQVTARRPRRAPHYTAERRFHKDHPRPGPPGCNLVAAPSSAQMASSLLKVTFLFDTPPFFIYGFSVLFSLRPQRAHGRLSRTSQWSAASP